MREKIFIGSSRESLEYAKIVKQQLCADYECVLWSEDFFDLNVSTYEHLYRQAYGFDYGIFVGGKDSVVRERKKDAKKARDNVVFELGLYAGILSSARTFFLLDKECKIFSDFDGITISFYSSQEEVEERCADIRKCIKRESRLSRPSALPAASSAISYYNNFIANIETWALEHPTFKLKRRTYDVSKMNVKIKVLLPKTEVVKMNSIDAEFYSKRKLQQISVSYAPDKRGLYLRVDKKQLKKRELVIYDVPTILDTSFDVVDMLSGKNFWGEDERTMMLKRKEVREFEKALINKVQENKWLSKRLECVDIDSMEERENER